MKATVANYCPSCGKQEFRLTGVKEYRCSACGYRYFQNVAAAVSAVVICKGELMLAQRAFEPKAGLFDFPGGFIDPDESMEQGLLRELQEELEWTPDESQLRYWFSSYNTYDFADVQYKTADVFFLIELDEKPEIVVKDDVADIVWQAIGDISDQQLAFDNVIDAVNRLRARTD